MTDDKSITVQRTIDASTTAVFDVLSNPERHTEIDGSGFVVSDEKTDRITGTGQVFRMNMTGDHMGGEYQTDNTVTGYDANHLLAWQTAPADTDPPGWEWVWELDRPGLGRHRRAPHLRLGQGHRPGASSRRSPFPLVDQAALEDSLEQPGGRGRGLTPARRAAPYAGGRHAVVHPLPRPRRDHPDGARGHRGDGDAPA